MENLVHYIIVRRDLPLGALLAQTAHAAGESFFLMGDGLRPRRPANADGAAGGSTPRHPATLCPGSSEKEHPVSNGGVAGSSPARGSTTITNPTVLEIIRREQAHTCIRDDGGTPNRRCYACEGEMQDAEMASVFNEARRRLAYPYITDCLCADPEHCTEEVPGYRCRRVRREVPKPTVVVLGARNEQKLLRLQAQLRLAEVPHVAVHEPDVPWCGALMAIGLVPGAEADLAEHVREFHMIRGHWHPESGVGA